MSAQALSVSEIASVRRLLDERAIERVLYDYARAADRGDIELMRSVYHSDALDDHGRYVGTADGFIDLFIQGVETGMPRLTNHVISNIRIDFVEDDVANVESYIFTHHTISDEDGERDDFLGGRYLDRFERRENRWRIAVRRCVFDWARSERATLDSWLTRFPGDYMRGERSGEDPSYGPWDRLSGVPSTS